MSFTDLLEEVKNLSPSDRLALAVELWDQVTAHPDDIPLTQTQIEELERRHAAYLSQPENVVTWDEVKANIRSQQR
jgi:putative addiction module component (TIGR02574 family)